MTPRMTPGVRRVCMLQAGAHSSVWCSTAGGPWHAERSMGQEGRVRAPVQSRCGWMAAWWWQEGRARGSTCC